MPRKPAKYNPHSSLFIRMWLKNLILDDQQLSYPKWIGTHIKTNLFHGH